jgi:uncharacterized damage-inducible protein DinB
MQKQEPQPEVWLRGPVPGIPAELQPVAHALLQAREDVERLVSELEPAALWAEPGGAASIGFHVRHMTGSLDRLLTYARGEALTDAQREALAAEKQPSPELGAAELLAELRRVLDAGLEQLAGTPAGALDEPRRVGRAGLPSTVRGLLYHAGEHTARHAGQISTTRRLLEGLVAGDREVL